MCPRNYLYRPMRSKIRKPERPKDGFSKQPESLPGALSLRRAHYKLFRKLYRVEWSLRFIPSMQATTRARVWTVGDFPAWFAEYFDHVAYLIDNTWLLLI